MNPAPPHPSGEERSATPLPLLFGFTSLFADMTYEMAHVLLPSLMLHLGGSAMETALMESFAEGTKMGGFLVSGRFGSAPGRESSLVRGGYGLTVLSTVLMGAAGSAGALIGLKSLSWFGKGLRGPARDALLSNALPKSALPGAFGTVRALDQTGGLAGPIVALALSGLLSPGNLLFLSAAPGLLCVMFSVLATRSALKARVAPFIPSFQGARPGILSFSTFRDLSPDMRVYVLGGTLLRAGMLPATLLMFRFASAGGTFFVMVAGFLLSSLLTILANLVIVRRWIPGSPRLLLGMSAPLLAISVLLLAPRHPSDGLYLAAMAAWGAGEAFASVGLKVRGAALFPPDFRNRGFALFEMSAALLSLLFWPLLADLWDIGQSPTGMGIAAGAAAMGGILLVNWNGETREEGGTEQ